MVVKLKNNVASTLRVQALSSDTTIYLPVGHGARFPTLGAGEYFYATIEDAAGNSEIVRATARVTDTLTVVRAAEGTTALTFPSGSAIEMRVTAASVVDTAQDAAQAAADAVDLAQFSVTASAAEINILDGATLSTAELNILDGVTASAAELNILDGVTASTAELNKLAGTPAGLTATELGYVDGVTSSIQTQINSKQATVTGAATTITASNLTVSRALVSDGSGKVAVATTTSTEIGYVNGVTSAIQTQLDSKYDSGDLASQAEAQAGTDNTKLMTPLRSAEAIAALSNGMVLLATLNTTSGQTVTASGLDLTTYSALMMNVDGVGDNSTVSGNFAIAGITLAATGATAASRIFGNYFLMLDTGIFNGAQAVIAPTALPQALSYLPGGGRTSITTTSTSISATMTATNFAAGTIRIYGLR